MGLSHDLVSQFAKIVNKDTKKSSETTVYGTVVTDGEGNKYVKLDGSDQLTPITNTSSSAKADERVSVLIKDHSATVTGNLSSPSVRTGDFNDLNDQVTDIKQFDLVIADRVEANEGYIQKLQTDKANVGDLTAATGRITELETKNATIEGTLNAHNAAIIDIKTIKIDAEVANAKFATIEKLTAATAEIDDLQTKNITIENRLTAHDATITNLGATYANIYFSNIGMAAVEQLFTKSGIIKDLFVGDTSITGELVGVTIKGDLIEGNTIKADKLVVKGSDGLFYKLNVDALGETTASSDEKYQNGLDGSVIVANSITAEKVNVKDLVAFGATIGGFHITDDSLYSGAKASADNTTRGIFLSDDGQFAVGDQNNFLKFYKDTDGTYKLAISAASMIFSASGSSVESVVNDAVNKADTANSTAESAKTKAEAAETAAKATFKSVDAEYYLSDYAASLSGGSWQSTAPEWQNGKYIWSRTKLTDQNNNVSYKPNENGVCITGNTGSKGDKGDTGATGVGVSSIVEQYYLSTSKDTPIGGSWSTDQPVWVSGKYIWTRSHITWSDGTESDTDPVLAEALNVEIGGRNLLIGTTVPIDLTGTGAENECSSGYNVSEYYIALPSLDGAYLTLSFDWRTGATSGIFKPQWNDTPWSIGNATEDDYAPSIVISSDKQSGKYSYTWKGDSGNYSGVGFRADNVTGVITIQNCKLELGTKATTWTVAPEDVQTNIDETNRQTRQDLSDDISKTRQDISDGVDEKLKNYVTAGQFADERDDIKDMVMDKFNFSSDRINDLEDSTNDRFDDISVYIRTDADGMELGKEGSPRQLWIDNDSIIFLYNGEPVSEWAGENFHTGNILVDVLERAQFGNFAFVPRSDGSLSFLKVNNYVSGNLFSSTCWTLDYFYRYTFIGQNGIKIYSDFSRSEFAKVSSLDDQKKYELSCKTNGITIRFQKKRDGRHSYSEYMQLSDDLILERHKITFAGSTVVSFEIHQDFELVESEIAPSYWVQTWHYYCVYNSTTGTYETLTKYYDEAPIWESGKYYDHGSDKYPTQTIVRNIKLVEVGS